MPEQRPIQSFIRSLSPAVCEEERRRGMKGGEGLCTPHSYHTVNTQAHSSGHVLMAKENFSDYLKKYMFFYFRRI